MKFEILAPAGSMESLIAGVRSGANAVYLGGKLFNARRNAGNFDDEELNKAVEYCHQRGVKAYLTLNILLSDSELKSAYNLVKNALEAGIDAFIVQDIGVAEMIKEHFPSARLHASTQMSIMTPAGVKAAEEMGFSRVVLPRELSAEEIAEIMAESNIELELFVHGALCMSVSGQCYLSSMIGSRSGNRGLCAQPCRLPFSADNSKSCDLSLKDLSLIKHISSLNGITSLKIEGRMKRPEYVSAAVSAVKKAIEGNYSQNDEIILKSVFSRSGFTDGYFKGRLGKDMFGTRQKEDVVAAKDVLKRISCRYNNENPILPIDLEFTCYKNAPCRLTASALGKTVKVTGDTPEKAINKPMTEETVSKRLSKFGGTQFYLRNIKISLDEGLIISASKLNDMRRQAVEKLNHIEKKDIISKPFKEILPCTNSICSYATAVFSSAAQIPDRHPFERIFIPIDSTIEDFIDNRAGVVIPRGLFGREKEIKFRLEKLKKAGISKALCGNLGSYKMAEEMGLEAYGDFGLNIFNSISAQQINSPILSFELTLEQANRISCDEKGIIVYGKVPLMLTRNCPVRNKIGCEKCKKSGTLTDRKGYKFPVVCNDGICSEVLNPIPIYMLDRLDEIKTDFIHFYFSTETKTDIEKIIDMYKSGAKPDTDYTRGLYQRGAL